MLITVGVILDTMRQIETFLLQRHYDGFLRRGKIRGRFDRATAGGQAANPRIVIMLWTAISVVAIIGIVYALIREQRIH
jgi:preprotein translocase subunit SecY